MPENYDWKDFGFMPEGNSLTDILSATIFAIDNELVQEKNMKYRRALVEAEYKLKDLLNTRFQEANSGSLNSKIVIYNN